MRKRKQNYQCANHGHQPFQIKVFAELSVRCLFICTEVTDQTERKPTLIYVFAGTICHYVVTQFTGLVQEAICLYLSHRQASKARTSLHICAVSPEHLLLAYKRYERRNKLSLNCPLLAILDSRACVFITYEYLTSWSIFHHLHLYLLDNNSLKHRAI